MSTTQIWSDLKTAVAAGDVSAISRHSIALRDRLAAGDPVPTGVTQPTLAAWKAANPGRRTDPRAVVVYASNDPTIFSLRDYKVVHVQEDREFVVLVPRLLTDD